MAVLLLAEVNNGELSVDATAKTVAAVKSLGDITVLAAGGSAVAAGEAAARIDGVSKVLVAEDASLGHRLAESTAALIVGLADGYEHIVAVNQVHNIGAYFDCEMRMEIQVKNTCRRAWLDCTTSAKFVAT